ncbi:hypothetical protein EE612_032936, partial [Oryza sativa]
PSLVMRAGRRGMDLVPVKPVTAPLRAGALPPPHPQVVRRGGARATGRLLHAPPNRPHGRHAPTPSTTSTIASPCSKSSPSLTSRSTPITPSASPPCLRAFRSSTMATAAPPTSPATTGITPSAASLRRRPPSAASSSDCEAAASSSSSHILSSHLASPTMVATLLRRALHLRRVLPSPSCAGALLLPVGVLPRLPHPLRLHHHHPVEQHRHHHHRPLLRREPPPHRILLRREPPPHRIR